ncbi:MAG: NAD-dependent epimerase/dehydratase family protein [Myxococcota bacterium]|nr:NAD-dependent epimerase/dehydratase family protein [Myxococcota bacterium]
MADVLVSGAGGFLGTHLTRVFIEKGHSVRAGDVEGADLSVHSDLGATPVVYDVLRPDTVEAATQGTEIVVHAAGIFDLSVDPERLWAVNAEGSRLAAEIAARLGVKRFVQVSSTSVYGRGACQLAEDGPKRPMHAYDRSKWAGEESAVATCQEAGLPCSVVRPTLIYGPGGRYGVAPAIALMALRTRLGLMRIPIAQGGPIGHMVHVEDVALATELVATTPAAEGGVFNLADDGPLRAGELIRLLAEVSGASISDRALPWWCAGLFKFIKPLARWWLRGQNRKLAHLWSKQVEEHDLVPALVPRLDVDWLDYIFEEHSFDNERIKALGFQFRHPQARDGLRSLGAWYRERRWIPPQLSA